MSVKGFAVDILTTFLPGMVLAIVIRIDAKLIGPYFALSELVPGFPGFDAPLWTQRGALRFAVARRALYPFLLGCLFSLIGQDVFTAAVAGSMAAFLLLWPGFFKPRPRGVFQRDWRLILLHLCLVAAFAGLSALGLIVVGTMEALGDGDIVKYVAENAFNGAVAFIATIAFSAFTKGLFLGLKEQARDRQDRSAVPMQPTNDKSA